MTRIESRFFQQLSPDRLAAFRIAFGVGLIAIVGRESLVGWASVDPVFWRPIRVLGLMPLPRLPTPVHAAVVGLLGLALVSFAIGFRTRTAATVACVTGLYVLGLPQHFGKVHHTTGLMVIVLGVFAVSRAGDRWSVDAWLHPVDAAILSRRQALGLYGWPIRLIQLLLTLVFFAAAVAKLRNGGVAWITSDQFALNLLKSSLERSSAGPTLPVGTWLARQDLLCHALAASALLLEFVYPLAWFWRGSRWVLVPAVVTMLVGIRLLMGPLFLTFMLLHLAWIPWPRLGRVSVQTRDFWALGGGRRSAAREARGV